MRQRPQRQLPPDGVDDNPDDMVDRVMSRLAQMEWQKSPRRRLVRGCVWGLILLLLAAGVLIGLQWGADPEKPIPLDPRQWSIFGGEDV